jgi:hypothetical protein
MTTFSEDSFQLDQQGNRVLVGLTVEETREFVLLDLGFDKSMPSLAMDDAETPEQQRWLELYEKHEVAMKPFISTHRTRH